AQEGADAEAAVKKKREEQYQALLKSGQAALAAKRFDEAIKAFTDAGQLMPGDKTGPDLAREAQRQRDAQAAADLAAKNKAAADLAARAKAEAAQKAAQVQQLLDAGRKALAVKQFDAAAKAFGEAGKLAPNDPNVLRALQ